MKSVTEAASSLNIPLFFGGHETFPFRYGWLTKGVDGVNHSSTFFSSEEAMIRLGVGKNMVKSIKHWCVATNLIKSNSHDRNPRGQTGFVLSEFGKALFTQPGFDPFLEDPATLWLIHWQLASRPQFSTMWYWLFNHWHAVEFTKEQVFKAIQKWLDQMSVKTFTESQLRRDLDCFLRCYLHSAQKKEVVNEDSFDCPLAELGLVVERDRTYQFRRGEQSTLPTNILIYALTQFFERNKGSANSIALSRLLSDAGSPGRVFKLDEASLVRRLEEIEVSSGGVFVYGESANIKQIYRRRDVSSLTWISKHYLRRTAH